jgi:hypothetical protein
MELKAMQDLQAKIKYTVFLITDFQMAAARKLKTGGW